MDALNCRSNTEYQKHINSIIEKVPGHCNKFAALCIMIGANIDELQNHVIEFCRLKRKQDLLKEDQGQNSNTD